MITENAFTIENVKYRDILTIDNLTIPRKLITCIVGESGSGKTTMLRLLNHLISADEGTITYQGKSLKNLDPIQLRRQVVLAPQSPVMFSGSIRDNLLAGLQFSRQPKLNDDTLKNVLKQMKLDKDLSDNVDNLSGGEKQRVALCRVLLMNPEVLLLDEPTSALDDATEGYVVRELAQECRKREITMIMVSHSQAIARDLANIIITIYGGRIQDIEEAVD